MWPLDGWPGASAPIARPEIMQRPDMQRVTSLPELSLHRRQPPSTTAPPASKTKRFQQSGGAGVPQMLVAAGGTEVLLTSLAQELRPWRVRLTRLTHPM